MKNIHRYSKTGLVAILIMFVLTGSNAQETRFTQPYASPLKLNPAIAGANKDIRMILYYRNQWGSLDKGYTTSSLTFLYPIFTLANSASMLSGESGKGVGVVNNKLDLGINATSISSGAFKTTDFSLSVGYNKRISEFQYLSAAIMGTFVQKSLDASKLTFDEQYVLGNYNSSNAKSEVIKNEKILYPTVGFGFEWFYNPKIEDGARVNTYIGVSGYNMNKPNESFTSGTGSLPQRYSYQAGIKILGANKVDVTPNIIVNSQKGDQEIAAGLYLDYRFSESLKFIVGGWYKQKSAIAVFVGIEHKYFTLEYNYDAVTNRTLSGFNTNSISLSFKYDQSKKKSLM